VYSRKNIGGVTNESSGGESRVEVPESEGVIPRRGESELSVGGDNNVGDEVVVSVLEKRKEGEERRGEEKEVSKEGHEEERREREGELARSLEKKSELGGGRQTYQDLLGVSVRGIVSGELPDDDGLVCKRKSERSEKESAKGREGGGKEGKERELNEKLNAPREEVKMTSGFSAEVAMAVTHPP